MPKGFSTKCRGCNIQCEPIMGHSIHLSNAPRWACPRCHVCILSDCFAAASSYIFRVLGSPLPTLEYEAVLDKALREGNIYANT